MESSRKSRLTAGLAVLVVLVAGAVVQVGLGGWLERIGWQGWRLWGLVLVASVVVICVQSGVALGQRRDGDGSVREELGNAIRTVTATETERELAELLALETTVQLSVEPDLRLVHNPTRPDIDVRGIHSVEQAWNRSKGRLLVVGEPGSGKTIAAYQSARLIFEEDPCQSPLVVNLSAWDGQHAFEEFLVDYLVGSDGWYESVAGGNRHLMRAWLNQGPVALVLDGLDEVGERWRRQCLDSFEQWLPANAQVVLTCRTEEYKELRRQRDGRGVRLNLGVGLEPLSNDQLKIAFDDFEDGEWRQLAQAWRDRPDDDSVREALRSPLLLNLARRAKIGVDELRAEGDHGKDAVVRRIIDTYLDSALVDDPALTRWAAWIAAYLRGNHPDGSGQVTEPHDSTVFHLSQLTPTTVPWPHSAAFGLVNGLAFGLAGMILGLSLSFSLGVMAVGGLVIGLFSRDASPQAAALRWPERRQVRHGLSAGLKAARLVGLGSSLIGFFLGGIFAFFLGLFFREPNLIMLTLYFALWAGLTMGLWFGLSFGLVVGGYQTFVGRWPVVDAARLDGPWRRSWTGLAGGLTSATAVGLAVGLPFAVVSGLDLSMPFAIHSEPGSELAIVLASVLGFGLGLGPVLSLQFGGWFLVQQRLKWLRLRHAARLHSQPLTVLQRGVEQGILRQVGSGVRFIHNEVRDALAERPPGAVANFLPKRPRTGS